MNLKNSLNLPTVTQLILTPLFALSLLPPWSNFWSHSIWITENVSQQASLPPVWFHTNISPHHHPVNISEISPLLWLHHSSGISVLLSWYSGLSIVWMCFTVYSSFLCFLQYKPFSSGLLISLICTSLYSSCLWIFLCAFPPRNIYLISQYFFYSVDYCTSRCA